MAVNHYFKVFSNDGSTTLFTSANTVNNSTIITVTETGLTIGTETYTYSGTKKFVGVSGSVSSTSPDYAIGESFDGGEASVYIVEAEATTSGVTVEYNGSVVATVEGGNTATLPIKDKKMKSDIVITVPEAEGVEEYDGAIVLKNAIGTFTHQYTGDSTDTTIYEFEVGMTWAEWAESDYDTNYLCVVRSHGLRWGGGSGEWPLYLNGVEVSADDLIISGATYTSSYSSGGGGSN